MLNFASTLTAEFRNIALSVGTLHFQSAITSTGAGIALFGANCPAGTLAAPAGWIRVVMPDGRLGYLPVWT